MKLTEIIQPVTLTETVGRTDLDITGIQMDSRLIEPGQLFVAVRGTQTDGHAYIDKAIEKGAVAVVCEQIPASTPAGSNLSEHSGYGGCRR